MVPLSCAIRVVQTTPRNVIALLEAIFPVVAIPLRRLLGTQLCVDPGGLIAVMRIQSLAVLAILGSSHV